MNAQVFAASMQGTVLLLVAIWEPQWCEEAKEEEEEKKLMW